MSDFCQPANRIYIAVVTRNLYCCASGFFSYHVCLLPHFLLVNGITIPFIFFLFYYQETEISVFLWDCKYICAEFLGGL